MGDGPFQDVFDACSNWARWGTDDQRGTLNLITADSTARAAALVRDGLTVGCGAPLNTVAGPDNSRPVTHLFLRAGDVADPNGEDGTLDYVAAVPHGQSHSHLDALCHLTWRGKIYNDRPASSVTSVGATTGAVTTARDGIVTRGVLLDIPHSAGTEWLEPGTPITQDDLERAEAACDVRVGEGDVLLVRTGRHRRRQVHGAWNLFDGVAGLHYRCGPWLHDRGIAVLGGDAINDVVPSRCDNVRLPVHTLAIAAMGMLLLDNLDLEELAAACAQRRRWEFLFMIAPLRLEGGTGSLVNPIAVF